MIRMVVDNVRNPAVPLPTWQSLLFYSAWPRTLAMKLLRVVYLDLLDWANACPHISVSRDSVWAAFREMAYLERAGWVLDRMRRDEEYSVYFSEATFLFMDRLRTLGYIAFIDRYLGVSHSDVWKLVPEAKRGPWDDVKEMISRAVHRMWFNVKSGGEQVSSCTSSA